MHPQRARLPHGFRREKAATEILVLDEEGFAADVQLQEKIGIVTVAGDAQHEFHCDKENHRHTSSIVERRKSQRRRRLSVLGVIPVPLCSGTSLDLPICISDFLLECFICCCRVVQVGCFGGSLAEDISVLPEHFHAVAGIEPHKDAVLPGG